MKNKKFVIPDGMEYFMPNEAKLFENLKQKALKKLISLGYSFVNPPIFDSLSNLLSLKATDLDIETLTITDQQSGGDIGIRADITPQIAKIDYQISNAKGINKYCYMGDILKSSSRDFDRKNPYQLGTEIFGVSNKNSDLDIIRSMIEIVSLSREKRLIIEIGNVSFINNLLDSFEISDEKRRFLVRLINLKSKSEIKLFCKENKMDKKKSNFLIELIGLSGDIKVLKEIQRLIKSNNMNFVNEINELKFVTKGIEKLRSPCELQIDLCELHGYEYQSSIVFGAYVPNFRKEIARGGRYNAYSTGKNSYREATGFSLDLKDIFNLSIVNERK
ncbi:MAG: ATP phosphoribosyltransferase regulatory subunit [Pseudomonadota bacterium]|nr:ATP phosphoribosyltransferase regulatory subunit [Pseudomonadota bacterium]